MDRDSERTARILDQMELEFEELESAATEDEIAAERAAAKTTTVKAYQRKRCRGSVWSCRGQRLAIAVAATGCARSEDSHHLCGRNLPVGCHFAFPASCLRHQSTSAHLHPAIILFLVSRLDVGFRDPQREPKMIHEFCRRRSRFARIIRCRGFA
jgi:hypothetical protein